MPSESTLWEAHKAVVRGCCMAMAAKHRKDAQTKLASIRQHIVQLENCLASKPLKTHLRSLLAARTQLRYLLIHKVERSLSYFKQNVL